MKAQQICRITATSCWRYRLVCLSLVSVVFMLGLAPTAWSSGSKTDVKIAALALRGDAEALKMWGATAAYLDQMIPGYTFTIVPYDFKTIGPAAQRGDYDFVIANPAIYVELEALYGVTRLATLQGLYPGRGATLFGGVIFCKSERQDINELKDLKNKSFLAVEENSFGGWRVAWRELHAAGIDPSHDFQKMNFAGTHDAVVYAVRDGKVDAGTVRTNLLEDMAKEGKIKLGEFKIINQKFDTDFNVIHSTRLYPEWPFARLRHTDDALAQKVVVALLSMQPGDMAAKAAKSAGWTTPYDYTDIHELFKELKLSPYQEYGKITLPMVLDKYRYPLAGGGTIIALMVALAILLQRLNAKLQRSNVALAKTHHELEAQSSILLAEQKKQRELISSIESAKRQWESTMDRVNDLVILADAEMRVKRCNKAVKAFSGLEYSAILGQLVTDFFPGMELDYGDGEGGKPFEYFHALSNRWYYLNTYRIDLGNGDEWGYVVMAHDLTEMKKITAELERKNEEIQVASHGLQRAIDGISAMIQRVIEEKNFGIKFTYDFPEKCYEIMACGQTGCPYYGKEAGSCWSEVGTFCGGTVQGAFAQKYSTCSQCKYFKRMTANPVNLIGELFNNMMFILNGKNQELQTAYSELKQAHSHLLQQEKMASIGQLAAGVAHEINNPVGFISSNLSSLQKYGSRLAEYIALEADLVSQSGSQELADRQAEGKKKYKVDYILTDIDDLVRESLDGCERVSKIVQNLKSFSRVDQATRQTVDIHECLDSTINIVWNELKYKAKIIKEYQAATPITCFPQQLNQVFMNLLVNAAHAIDKEGLITIKTWQDETFLSIAISDNGSGIAPENVSRIFEPFFTTKEVGKGTGLGLSIVYEIVSKNHHGDILVDSKLGQGTTFTVKIPFGEK